MSGTCHKGEVPNCEVMDTKNLCMKCEDNYTLVTMRNLKSYCYPIDPIYKCKEFDPKKFQSSIFSCEKCVDDMHILSESKTDRYDRTCMKFRFIQNCTKYDNNPIAIADSNFICIECNDLSYLKEGACPQRTALPDECTLYDKYSDKCLKCQKGYFISTDGKRCEAFPQGIPGCRAYRTKTICKACIEKMYLKDEICVSVLTEMPGCKYYDDEDVCLECEVGYVNFRGVCQAAVA